MKTAAPTPATRKLAVILIVCAVFGTEVSYHFSIESRFDALEQKLQQNGVAMQNLQESIDAVTSAKTESLTGLNKEVEKLQTSFAPLGKSAGEQADALALLRKQVALLQQAQGDQQAAQKKLAGSLDQLEKLRLKARQAEEAAALVPPAAAATPVVATTPSPVPAPAAPLPPAAPAASPVTSAAPAPLPPAPAPPAAAPAPAPVAAPVSVAPVAPVHTSAVKSKNKTNLLASTAVPLERLPDHPIDLRPDDTETGLPSPGMMAANHGLATPVDSFDSVRALPVGPALSSKN